MFIALLILWLIFGGVSVTSLVLGVIVSALITLFAMKFMGYSSAHTLALLKKSVLILRYIIFLLKEIVEANLCVIRLVYSKREMEPLLVRFNAGLKTDPARVLVANSITLTPGTITVELDGDELCVHALDRTMDLDVESLDFIKRARRLEE